MTIATYSELVTEAQDWLFGRTDIAAKVPTFLRMFEAKGNRILQCRQMEKRSSATVNLATTQPEFVSLPTDFQTMRRIRILNPSTGTGTPKLDVVTPDQLDMYREKDNSPGQPTKFAVFGDELELYPTPSLAFNFEMIYRATLAPLDNASNTHNWLLDLAPDLYLYGTLMEAAPYLHEDERIPVWAQGVASGFEQLNTLSDRATYNAGPLVIRRRRGGY